MSIPSFFINVNTITKFKQYFFESLLITLYVLSELCAKATNILHTIKITVKKMNRLGWITTEPVHLNKTKERQFAELYRQ